jgi:cytochrome c556
MLSPPQPLPPVPDPPGERTYAHWDAATQAGRAIIQGDLRTAAPHLAWLAHHEYPQKLPPHWRAHAPRMQLAARVLARATTPAEALRALPALDAACGACHADLSDVDFNATKRPLQHGDGTLALLDGLSGPADAVFARAASVTPRVAGKSDAAALAALKAASARAEVAKTWVERLAATEEIFGQCGACHEGLR